jgi:hypothetical protein
MSMPGMKRTVGAFCAAFEPQRQNLSAAPPVRTDRQNLEVIVPMSS